MEERTTRYLAERLEQAVKEQEAEAIQSRSSSAPKTISPTTASGQQEEEPMKVEKAKGDTVQSPWKR